MYLIRWTTGDGFRRALYGIQSELGISISEERKGMSKDLVSMQLPGSHIVDF
jgi:hypothetical protein